jgi:hypothetical protein
LLLVTAAALMAGCSSPPQVRDIRDSRDIRDGPGADPPPDLASRPDAEPRIEPLRIGGPNKPYEVLGQRYVPVTSDQPLWESGGASWYGRKFHGQPTANGEIYDMYAMTAAHKTMPLPSYAVVRNPANGREVVGGIPGRIHVHINVRANDDARDRINHRFRSGNRQRIGARRPGSGRRPSRDGWAVAAVGQLPQPARRAGAAAAGAVRG